MGKRKKKSRKRDKKKKRKLLRNKKIMNELDILTKPQVCEPDKFLDELNEDANYMYEAKYDPKELEKRMCEVWDKWHKPMPELDQVRDLLFESKKN